MIDILTVENKSKSMNDVSDELDEYLQFGIIDYSDEDNVDYQFIPFLFGEKYNMSAIELKIGEARIKIPADWSIVIGDKHSGELELLEVKKMTDRTFEAFVFNPITGFFPKFLDIEIMNIYPDIKWYVPKLKSDHILVCPITSGDNPDCVFIVKETNKLPESLDLSQLI